MKIRVGSRDSKLAIAQSQIVIDYIKKSNPIVEVSLITMKTTGDIILDKSLDKIGGKGLFVKELDEALLENKVDITVHSYKDMPMELNEKLPVVAVSKRENPIDVLVLPLGTDTIDFSKPIGCSSARRKIQLEKIYPKCVVKPIRGNVQTRLQKVDSGQFSATVLAYAGLKRLGLLNRVARIFTTDEILPCACQGIIAVQARKDTDTSFLDGFNDEKTYDISVAERSFVRQLDGGCSSPVAGYAQIKNNVLTLTGMYVDDKENIYKKKITGQRKEGEALGKILADEIIKGEF